MFAPPGTSGACFDISKADFRGRAKCQQVQVVFSGSGNDQSSTISIDPARTRALGPAAAERLDANEVGKRWKKLSSTIGFCFSGVQIL